MDQIMEIIEQIWAIDLVRFIVFLLVAFIAAGIAKLLVTKVLKLIKVDKLFDKWGINDGPVGTSMNFVGRLVYLIVFLMFLPSALDALGLTSVSDPISGFVRRQMLSWRRVFFKARLDTLTLVDVEHVVVSQERYALHDR